MQPDDDCSSERVFLLVGSTGVKVASAELGKVPKNKKLVSGRDAQVLMNLVDALEDHDDVQKVFYDFDLSDEALASLSRE